MVEVGDGTIGYNISGRKVICPIFFSKGMFMDGKSLGSVVWSVLVLGRVLSSIGPVSLRNKKPEKEANKKSGPYGIISLIRLTVLVIRRQSILKMVYDEKRIGINRRKEGLG